MPCHACSDPPCSPRPLPGPDACIHAFALTPSAGADALQFRCYRVENEADVESTTDAACKMAFGGGNPLVAILLAQRMVSRTKPKGH